MTKGQRAILRSMILDPENLDNVYSSYLMDFHCGIDVRALAIKEKEMVRDGLLPKTNIEQEGLGADPAGMWTHYPWFHLAFHEMHPDAIIRVVDVGAGIGRLGFYMEEFFYDVEYVGLELYAHRVEASGAKGLTQWDIGTQGVPPAEIYWYYNALSEPAYAEFIRSLTSYKARGDTFQVWSLHDPYGGLAELLTESRRIRIDSPVPMDLILYTTELAREAAEAP